MMRKLFLLLIPVPFILFSGARDPGRTGQRERCIYCHKPKDLYKVVHKVLEEDCAVCHEPINPNHPKGGPGFKLTAEIPDLCLMCHDLGEAKYDHPPAQEDCTICHSPHSSPYRYMLLENPVSDLCYICHENLTKNMNSVHLPVKQGTCQQCHNPHKSDNPALLIRKDQELCLGCHDKLLGTKTHPVENIAALLSGSKYIHGALEMGGCAGCHVPHASEYPKLLIASFPGENYSLSSSSGKDFELCFSCHDSEMITAGTTVTATNFRNGNDNLHFRHVSGGKGRSCIICHNPHASDQEHLIKAEVAFGKWEMKINYHPTVQGGSCAPGCHAKKSYQRNVR